MKKSFGPLTEAYQAGLKGKPCPLMFREPSSLAHKEYLKGCQQAKANKDLKALDRRLAKLANPPFAAVLQVFYEYQKTTKLPKPDTMPFYGFRLIVSSWAGCPDTCGKIEWDSRHCTVAEAEKFGREIAERFSLKLTEVSLCQEITRTFAGAVPKKRHYKGEKNSSEQIRGWVDVIRKQSED